MSDSSMLAFTLHLGQIASDDEQGWRLQAGGDGLADVDVARDHHAIDGCSDDRVTQVDLRLIERGLRLHDLRFGSFDGGIRCAGGALCRFEIGLRESAACRESSCARLSLRSSISSLHLGPVDISLKADDCGLRLLDLRLEE